MKQPILAHRFIGSLGSHSLGNDDGVGDSKKAQQAPENRDRCQAASGSAYRGKGTPGLRVRPRDRRVGNGRPYSTLLNRESFLPSARVFSDDAVAYPRHTAGQLFARKDPEGGSCFGRRVAGNVEKTGDSNAAVRNRHGDVAYLIDEPCVEHGAVELSPALEH